MAVYNPSRPPAPGGPNRGRQPARQHAHLRLTHADRDAAADLLKDAYADGRLDEDEFDDRLNRAMAAKVQADLEPLFTDLATQSAGAYPAQPPMGPQADLEPPAREDKMWAAAGHVSGYFTLALGPLLLLLVKGRVSPFIRRQAMEALNYQITIMAATALMTVAWILVVPIFVYLFMMLGFVFLPAIAGLGALLGFNWRYPFTWRPVRDNPDVPR